MTAAWWKVFPTAGCEARVRLFCFPYAGGSGSVFHRFGQALPSAVEVVSLQAPGRSYRLCEPPVASLEALLLAIEMTITPWLDRPYALFGHSFGALVAFETARRLRRAGQVAPLHLFASASPAPQVPRPPRISTELGARDFWTAVQQIFGAAPDGPSDQDFLDLVVPPLKEDFRLLASYRYQPDRPLGMPISAFYGAQDPTMSAADAGEWAAQTTGLFSVQEVQGPHLYVRDAPRALVETVSRELRGAG